MRLFWQGFVMGVLIVLAPSMIYLAVLIQRSRDVSERPYPQAADLREGAGACHHE